MNELARVEERKKRRGKKKRRKTLKKILMAISVVIIFLASFVITVKICKPDFDFQTLIPQKAVVFIREDVLKQTTTTTTKPTTTTTTAPTYYDYIDSSEFAFDGAKQGNQLGSILNESGGVIAYNASYIFFAKDGSGIYRFASAEETTKKLQTDVKNCSSLNVVGNILYFVNNDTNELLKCSVNGGKTTALASDVSMCYVYNSQAFYMDTDRSCGYVDTTSGEKYHLFTAAMGNELSFVGISLSRVFLTEYNPSTHETEYITVSLNDYSDINYFRAPTFEGDIVSMFLENGFFYYYQIQEDGNYDLCRQKYGSQKIVTLLQNVSSTDYPVVCLNRLYYAEIDDNKFKAKELNMNGNKRKTMITVSDVRGDAKLGIGYGYQYIFVTGKKSENGKKIYKGTCIYTSSSSDNVMDFKDSKWQY